MLDCAGLQGDETPEPYGSKQYVIEIEGVVI